MRCSSCLNCSGFVILCLLSLNCVIARCLTFSQNQDNKEVDGFCDSLSDLHLPTLELPQPVEERVSVLLLNWKRSANLKKIIEALQTYDEVSDIILMVGI